MPTFTEPPSIDMTPPTVLATSPSSGVFGVRVADNIVFTFSEPIQRGSGNIVLKTAAGTTIATYDAATSTNLSISDSTLTINPSADLGIFTGYQVEIAAGAIKDMAGNNYAGESNYNFTTQTLDSLMRNNLLYRCPGWRGAFPRQHSPSHHLPGIQASHHKIECSYSLQPTVHAL